jgi:transglutaminase-like putative cysteine protease
MRDRGNTVSRAALGLAAVLLISATAAAASPQQIRGSYWYIVDHVVGAAPDALVEIWVALPVDRPGQRVQIIDIEPTPAVIVEDRDNGNRILSWRLTDLGDSESFLCHYDFALEASPVEIGVDPDLVEPYATESTLYARFTRPEFMIETDGDVAALARRIVGDQTHPYQQARLIFDWMLTNLEFVPGGRGERSALATARGGAGDCTQYSLLFCGLCRSLGIPARTVTCEWLTVGRHVLAEFYLPPYGWVPVDASAAQMFLPSYNVLDPAEVTAFLETRGIPGRDPAWLFGNLYPGRLIITVGNNIDASPQQDGESRIYHFLQPGGPDAVPPAMHCVGLNDDAVQGGFFHFGEPLTSDEAHELAYQRLASLYFAAGLYSEAEEGCMKTLADRPGEATAWINLGRVYLRKGLYSKAEAALRRALAAMETTGQSTLESRIWTHNYLGNCYDLMGHRELAIQEYRQVLTLGENDRGALEYARRHLNNAFTTSDF